MEEEIGRVLRVIEAAAHQGGWDLSAPPYMPGLYLIYDRTDEESHRRMLPAHGNRRPIYHGRFAAKPLFPPEAAPEDQSTHMLFRMALQITADDPKAQMAREYLAVPSFAAMAFISEGWFLDDMEKVAQAHAAKRRFVDTPGAREERSIMAADVNRIDYWLMRVRGQEPVLMTFPAPALDEPHPRDGASGSVIESLRVIVAALTGNPLPKAITAPTGWTGS